MSFEYIKRTRFLIFVINQMRIIRKLKKLLGGDTRRERDARRQSVPMDMDYGPLPSSFFGAVNTVREQAGYETLPIFPHDSIGRNEENLRKKSIEDQLFSFSRSQSKSRQGSLAGFGREGSPEHFNRPVPGTPIKYRRRPISPDLLRPSNSEPFLYRQQSIPNSPEMIRHFQHNARQQQQRDMMMAHAARFFPQVQQQQQFFPVMNPNANMQNWFMMPPSLPPQQQMYPFY